MVNIIDDLSKLTTIPENILIRLLKKEIYCICEAIEEDIADEKAISELNLGIGTLYIKHDQAEEVKYKFVPNNYMEKCVNSTVSNKQNLLEAVLCESLAKKFIDVYKDLC